jgi:hypothetical protein
LALVVVALLFAFGYVAWHSQRRNLENTERLLEAEQAKLEEAEKAQRAHKRALKSAKQVAYAGMLALARTAPRRVAALVLAELPESIEASDAAVVAREVADGLVPHVALVGHAKSVTWASFSPNGKQIVSASADGTARVWNADGSAEPVLLKGHQGAVRSAAFSPDGKHIVTDSSNEGFSWEPEGSNEPDTTRINKSRFQRRVQSRWKTHRYRHGGRNRSGVEY